MPFAAKDTSEPHKWRVTLGSFSGAEGYKTMLLISHKRGWKNISRVNGHLCVVALLPFYINPICL